MSAQSDLENYRIQLQQVEAALLGEPNNEELNKLKQDLVEIIQLSEELVGDESALLGEGSRAEGPSNSGGRPNWKVGDKCMAPSANGQRYAAVIDGISQDRAAITFTGNGMKHMVQMGELSLVPNDQKKNYVFQSNKAGPKKEWQKEREMRKLRAQKKEQRKKTLDEAKEQEKSRWKTFNAKANHKQLKGMKRVEASSSAADGGKEAPERKATISSRKDNALGRTQRGNMDSLF